MHPLLRFLPALLMAPLLLWGLPGQGADVYDEAQYMLGANTIARGIGGVLRGESIGALQAELHRTGGTLLLHAKPAHIGFLAMVGLLLGGLTAFKAALFSVACALGSALLVVRLGEKLAGPGAGLAAGFLWATNPLAIEYGRSQLSIASSVFFLLLGFWLALEARDRRPRLLGFAAGAALFVACTCHYNVVLAILVLVVLLWNELSGELKAWIFAGGAALGVLVEGMLLIVDFGLRNSHPEFMSLLGEIWWNLNDFHLKPTEGAMASPDGVRGNGLEAWLYWAQLQATGLHLLPVLALALVVPARRALGPRQWVLLAGWALVPWLIWTIYPWKVERVYLMVVPGMAIFAAAAVVELLEERGLRVAVVAGLAAVGVMVALPRVPVGPSPYAAVVAANREALAALPEGAVTAISFPASSVPIWKWHLGPEQANRGRAVPAAIDFSSFGQPLLITEDRWSARGFPYAGGLDPAAFNVPWGEGVAGLGGRYGFLAAGALRERQAEGP